MRLTRLNSPPTVEMPSATCTSAGCCVALTTPGVVADATLTFLSISTEQGHPFYSPQERSAFPRLGGSSILGASGQNSIGGNLADLPVASSHQLPRLPDLGIDHLTLGPREIPLQKYPSRQIETWHLTCFMAFGLPCGRPTHQPGQCRSIKHASRPFPQRVDALEQESAETTALLHAGNNPDRASATKPPGWRIPPFSACACQHPSSFRWRSG